MAKQKTPFRAWLDKRKLTLQQFANAVPGISYGFVTKHASASKTAPRTVDPRIKEDIIKAGFADCPLAR